MSIVHVDVVGKAEINATVAKIGAINVLYLQELEQERTGQPVDPNGHVHGLWPIEIVHVRSRTFRVVCVVGERCAKMMDKISNLSGIGATSLPTAHGACTRIPENVDAIPKTNPPHIRICTTLVLMLEAAFAKFMYDPGARDVFEWFWSAWRKRILVMTRARKSALYDSIGHWVTVYRSRMWPHPLTQLPPPPQPPLPPLPPPATTLIPIQAMQQTTPSEKKEVELCHLGALDLSSASSKESSSSSSSSKSSSDTKELNWPNLQLARRRREEIKERGLDLNLMRNLFSVTTLPRGYGDIWKQGPSPVDLRYGPRSYDAVILAMR